MSVSVDAASCYPLLTWGLGNSNCPSQPGISYNVYRSNDPLFVPEPATLLVAGVAATSYVDTEAVAGEAYFYLVRAEDGQSSQGGPANGGREDVNEVVQWLEIGDPGAGGNLADDAGDSDAWLSSGYWSVSDTANSTPAGRFSYHSAMRGSVVHGSQLCAALTTPPLELLGGASLTYDASYNLEEGWDGVVVEISTDGGVAGMICLRTAAIRARSSIPVRHRSTPVSTRRPSRASRAHPATGA